MGVSDLVKKFTGGRTPGFIFWIVAARLYSTESIGITSALISAVGLIAVLSTLGFEFSIIRFLPSYITKPGKLLNSCFAASGLLALILSTLFLLGLDIWAPDLIPVREQFWLIIAFIALSVSFTLSILTDRSFIALRKAQYALIQSAISGLVRFIPLLALVGVLATFGVFVSWVISFVAAFTIGLFVLLGRAHASYKPSVAIESNILKTVSRFSLLNYLVNLFWSAPGFILPLMVIYLLGADQNAFFYIGWAVGSVLFMIPQAISFTLLAEGSHDQEKLALNTRRSIKLISFLAIPAVLIVLVFGDWLLRAFGEAYSQNATELLRVLAISVLPLSVNSIYISIKRVQMAMSSIIALTVFVTLATLILSYILIPDHGIVGVGISWLVAHSLPALIILLLAVFKNKTGQSG
jgi:O-antigen/teichoic acid export membrane protein